MGFLGYIGICATKLLLTTILIQITHRKKINKNKCNLLRHPSRELSTATTGLKVSFFPPPLHLHVAASSVLHDRFQSIKKGKEKSIRLLSTRPLLFLSLSLTKESGRVLRGLVRV